MRTRLQVLTQKKEELIKQFLKLEEKDKELKEIDKELTEQIKESELKTKEIDKALKELKKLKFKEIRKICFLFFVFVKNITNIVKNTMIKNKDKIKEYNKEYYKTNKDKISAKRDI